jgi:hypothetical protein
MRNWKKKKNSQSIKEQIRKKGRGVCRRSEIGE